MGDLPLYSADSGCAVILCRMYRLSVRLKDLFSDDYYDDDDDDDLSMSKTFTGGAVCREFETEVPAAEEMLD